jgi:hypothetical protein
MDVKLLEQQIPGRLTYFGHLLKGILSLGT